MRKYQAIDYATSMGWTKADAGRAFEGVDFPAEEITILNKMVQFAGPELVKRQYLQRAQRTQVTINKNRLTELEEEHKEMIVHYQTKLDSERTIFVSLIRITYNIARLVGYREPWIEALLDAYNQSHDGDKAA